MTAGGQVVLHRATDPAHFFDRCRDFLLASEAEHNLIIGFSAGLLSGDHPWESPVYLAWIERDGEVIGYAFRTPPYKVGVSRLPPEALPLVADDLAEVYDSVPAFMGADGPASELARIWAERHGGRVVPGMRLRIHAATEVDPEASTAPGRLRRAGSADRELCIEWGRAFAVETGVDGTDAAETIPRMIDAGALFLWELSGEVVSMAGASGATPSAMRVGWVYTPRELRGNGYATSCVAGLTEHLFATGRTAAFLFTDLANPTSNAIYHRIGYRPVCDVADYWIR